MSSSTLPLSLRGSSPTGNLDGEPASDTPILNLPFEMLIAICEAVISIPSIDPDDSIYGRLNWVPQVNIRDLARLAQTCKIFRKAARPVLYRHFDITWLHGLWRPNRWRKGEHFRSTHKFFQLLSAMKTSGSADLVRYIDMVAIASDHALRHWNQRHEYRDQPCDDFENISDLLAKFNLNITNHVSGDRDVPTTGNAVTTGSSVLLILSLLLFRNIVAARLPIDETAANLLQAEGERFYIEDEDHRFRDEMTNQLHVNRLFFKWASRHTHSLKSPAFPCLTALELAGHDEQSPGVLRSVHLRYIIANAPRLHILRLHRFTLVANLDPEMDLSKITTLVLKCCSFGYDTIWRLATACNRLRTFKISQGDNDAERQAIIWQGEEPFDDQYIGVHPEDRDDPEDNPWNRHKQFPDFPWSSHLVSSSLVMQALSPAAETLESVWLGQCTPVLVDVLRAKLNHKRRRLDCTNFPRLQSLGLWSENLFPVNKTNDGILSEIVRGARRLTTLSIFSRNGSVSADEEDEIERALETLSLDIESGRVKTHLDTIRICRVYQEDPIGEFVVRKTYSDTEGDEESHDEQDQQGEESDGTTSQTGKISDEPKSEIGECSGESGGSDEQAQSAGRYEEDQAETDSDGHDDQICAARDTDARNPSNESESQTWSIKPPKLETALLDRLARCGIRLVRVRDPKDNVPRDTIEKQPFPNPPKADNYLWED